MTQGKQRERSEIVFWQALSRAHESVLTVLEQELEPRSLTPIGLEVLRALASCPDQQMRMADLAKSVRLSRSGLTRLLDRLHRQGWVERCDCPDDGRGAFAVLTRVGEQTLDRALPVYGAVLQRYVAHALHDGEIDTLTDALVRMQTATTTGAGRDERKQTNNDAVVGTTTRGRRNGK